MHMIFRHKYHGGTWIDLEQPSEDEIRSIVHEFSIGENIETELFSPTPTPIILGNADSAFLVLHFPAHGAKNGETGNQEIDIIIGKKYIITVHYEVIAPIYHLKKLLETQELVETTSHITTDTLLEIIFIHLYTAVRNNITNIAERLAHTEKEMFNGNERSTVRMISIISRDFLHMEAALANQQELLNRFFKAIIERAFFDTTFAERVEHILTERDQISQLTKTHRAIATELRETNIALLEARQNEIMKTLTIVNFIFLPLGLISWTFSMRTEGMPFIHSPHAFWIVLGIMASVAIILTAFFVRKRWLS